MSWTKLVVLLFSLAVLVWISWPTGIERTVKLKTVKLIPFIWNESDTMFIDTTYQENGDTVVNMWTMPKSAYDSVDKVITDDTVTGRIIRVVK